MNEQLVELNRSLEQQVKLVAQKNLELHDLNGALEDNLVHSMELCVHTMEPFTRSWETGRGGFSSCANPFPRFCNWVPKTRGCSKRARLFYDIGMEGVPRQIIRHWQESPPTLSQAEKTLVEQHPILGQELTAFGSNLETVGKIIRAHHENFDGSGYPDQLSAENIPWLARLLAVTVAFVSSPFTDADAVDKLKEGAGSLFDPEAVRIFVRAHTVAVVPRKERQVFLTELRTGHGFGEGHSYL